MPLGIVSATILMFNLPFGYWWAHTDKFSLQWFLAVHLPVLFAFCVRSMAGVSLLHLATFPAVVGAYAVGQFLGAKLHTRWQKREGGQLTACLVCDLWKKLCSSGTRTL